MHIAISKQKWIKKDRKFQIYIVNDENKSWKCEAMVVGIHKGSFKLWFKGIF